MDAIRNAYFVIALTLHPGQPAYWASPMSGTVARARINRWAFDPQFMDIVILDVNDGTISCEEWPCSGN